MNEEELVELEEAFVEYQEFLESDKKLTIKITKEILADYNLFMKVLFKKLREQGLFDDKVPDAPNSMFA